MFPQLHFNRIAKALFGLLLGLVFSVGLLAQDGHSEYCEPDISPNDEIYITYFGFNNISNPSGSDGFTYYPNPTASIIENTTYNYSIGFNTGGPKYYAVFVDYDGDKDFTGPGELVSSGFTTQIEVSTTFTTPASIALNGFGRMRVILSDVPITHPCFIYAEMEDYSIQHLKVSDPDWDIIVASGLYLPGSTPALEEDHCAYYRVSLKNVSFQGGVGQSTYMPYEATFTDVSTGALVHTYTGIAYIQGYNNQVYIPIKGTQVSNFAYMEKYHVVFEQQLSDDDCFNHGADKVESVFQFNMSECSVSAQEEHGLIGARSNEQNTIRANQELNENSIRLSPNPFGEMLNVQLNLVENTSTLNISVFNIFGQKVLADLQYSDMLEGQFDIEINTAQLTSGTYYFIIETDNSRKTQKLLKF